ncbi:hypothetical protein M0G43_09070 [Subsaxibacter sp. CAU 1640]|uniref:hypothetical protein n=1 Tax=Subsaxibacter sp. CAU 1640 TaxID=2933271 RepID=UPI0020058231|nr:hypothetical protein [Subsaxibacter sp. CAU 1640]MCK7590723.1 hypothetical protein [Subsaxibacter sp. CAU 1640]
MRPLPTFLCFFLISTSLFSNDLLDNIVFSKAEIVNEYTTRIPFKLIDHLIVVEAELLDKKGNFIIDTGSESLILNKIHFESYNPYYKKSKETSGVLNTVDNPLERQLKEFVIKNLVLTNKTSDIIDLSHIEKTKKMNLLGIIGFNVLKDYEIFIDMYLNQITLSKVDSKGNTLDEHIYLETIVDSVDFKLKNHTIVLDTYVDKHKLSFGLDTAAEYNQINKRLNKKVLKFFYPMRHLELSDASGHTVEVLAGKLYRVKLSDSIFFAPMETVLSNLNNLNEAFGTSLDGILGYEFFKQKRTIINYQKQKLYFVNYPIVRN